MGTLHEQLEAATRPVFERNFEKYGEIGASVSVFVGETEVLNLSQGYANRERTRPWTDETLVPVWSATKGPAAVACLLALEEAELPLDMAVSEVWPRFVGEGREHITFRQVLNHTSGLSALDKSAPIQDHRAVVEALQTQKPAFPPGTRQAYHARTFGFLVDEIVRCVTGADTLGGYFHECIGGPMNLDFWIGLLPGMMPRVAQIYPGKMRSTGEGPTEFQKAYGTKGSLTQRTFASPTGLNAVSDLNHEETLTRGYASMGGVGSARGLAAFYAMLANGGEWRGEKLVSSAILDALQTTSSQQEDAVLQATVAFSAGMMRDPVDGAGNKIRRTFGSGLTAFGHPGAGGSLAFADPGRGYSFAYVMNQMELGALPGEKTLGLMEAVDGAI